MDKDQRSPKSTPSTILDLYTKCCRTISIWNIKNWDIKWEREMRLTWLRTGIPKKKKKNIFKKIEKLLLFF